MKKVIIITSCCLLALGMAFAGEPSSPSAADQKWLAAVEKMVAEGKTKVSTPSKDRVALLEKWAEKKGYSVKVTKNDTTYRMELAQNVAKK